MPGEDAKGKIFVSEEPETDYDAMKYKSLGHRLIEKLSNEQADLVVYIEASTGKEYTGADVKEKVLNIAAALMDKYDLKQGSGVCISFDHCIESVLLALGVICAGGFVACAFPLDPYAELEYLAKKVDPKFLFCNEQDMHWGKKLEKELEHEVVTISMTKNSSHKDNLQNLLDYDHRKSQKYTQGLIPMECKDLKEDVAFVTMSSGTTGKPKAVPSSHWNCVTDLVSRLTSSKWKLEVIFANTASLDYVSGRLILLGAIESGYTAVIIGSFEPKSFCEFIEKYRINFVYLGAAAFYNLITYKSIQNYDLSSMLVIFPMGARITYINELRSFFQQHPSIKFVRQGYGTSEFAGASMNSMTPEIYLKDCDNAGKLMSSVRLKVIDPETSELLGYNKQGLLYVSGPRVFRGYYDASRLKEGFADPYFKDDDMFDEDGFYKSGDLGYMDENEDLHVIGRMKELMHCRGSKKVLPQELEELISEHPAVDKVCVLGIPNQKELTLHCPRAFIVPKSGYCDKIGGDKDLNFCNQEVNINNNDNSKSQLLKRKGQHKFCTKLSEKRRHQLEENIMNFVNNNIGWEKQLTGGIVILDDVGTRGSSGKIDKNFIRSLTLDNVEIYGDLSV